MRKLTFLAVIFAVILVTGNLVAIAEINPLAEKVIALDAGHGGGAKGAQYPANCLAENPATCLIFEEDVNLDVVNALYDKLTAAGATVVFTERVSSRKARVDSAIEKCKASEAGRKCDVLLSVHHNGNVDSTYDGTLVIYNEKKDIALATAMHDALIAGLGLLDEEYLHGGYGMTVYGNTVSALTEGYYITNDCEAELYLYQTTMSSCDKALYPDGDRVDQEAQILFDGLEDYFIAQAADPGPGGGKGNGKGPKK